MAWYENKKLIEEQFLSALKEGTGCDPFNGGCLIVAQAIQAVIGGELGVLVNNEGEAMHAVVSVGGKLWDFDGPLEPEPFISRYNKFVDEPQYIAHGYRKREGWDLSEASENNALASRLATIIQRVIPEDVGLGNGKIEPVKWPPIFDDTRYHSTNILWHGTPHNDFKPQDIRPTSSFISGVFLTGAPEVAALYAGEHGVVHGYELRADASLLNAATDLRLRNRRSFNYPSADEWAFVKEFLSDRCAIEVEPGTFRMLDSRNAGSKCPPLGLEGQLSWSALFLELCDVPDDAELLLKEMGYDGVTRVELLSWVLADRQPHIVAADNPYGRLCSKLKFGGNYEHFVVAVRDPSVLAHSISVSAVELASDLESGRGPCPVYENDLNAAYKRPNIARSGVLTL